MKAIPGRGRPVSIFWGGIFGLGWMLRYELGSEEVCYIVVLYGLEPDIDGHMYAGHGKDELQIAIGIGEPRGDRDLGVGKVDDDIELTNELLLQAIE